MNEVDILHISMIKSVLKLDLRLESDVRVTRWV